jgi:hypothetical protein
MLEPALQALVSGLGSRQTLVAENLASRHQIEVRQRNRSRSDPNRRAASAPWAVKCRPDGF